MFNNKVREMRWMQESNEVVEMGESLGKQLGRAAAAIMDRTRAWGVVLQWRVLGLSRDSVVRVLVGQVERDRVAGHEAKRKHKKAQ